MARALVAATALAALSAQPFPVAAAPKPKPSDTKFSYTVREARAYAYRVTLRKEVIEGARQADPCDPEEDPYQCDTTRYEHEPNCPMPLTTGPTGAVPEVRPVPGAKPLEGGAGAKEGTGSEPPTASPVTLNELISLARLGHVGGLVEAGGLASDSYVDLSGRQEPTLHTESDVLPGLPKYEERCLDEDPSHRSYRKLLSRTVEAPETYHLAECRKDECTFDRLTFSAQDVMARTIVHLKEEAGKVIGQIQATFHDATWSNGAFAVDSVDTILTFESDGTAEGLKWSVGTTANGARLGGNPVTLPTGRLIGTDDLQAGIAAPYVSAADDGSTLRIVAPGVVVASREQTAWFGGAEVDATFGRSSPTGAAGTDGAGDPAGGQAGSGAAGRAGGAESDVGGTSGASAGGAVGEAGAGPGDGASGEPMPGATPVAGSPEAVSVSRFETELPFVLIVGGGLLAALWIVARWMRQFPAGAALSYYPPFSLIDRLYRTFAKS
ncbi:MAG: hypothetical protein ACRDHM_07740 [Actinomycetota bacterium]